MNKFTKEFKEKAIKLHAQGISANKIFKDAGINTNGKQKDYAVKTINYWKRKNKDISNKTLILRELEKELEKLQIKVKLMEKESVLFPLLRKETKLKRIKEKKFKIIYEIRKENPNFSLEKLLNFYSLSSSGYYKYLKEIDEREEKDFNLFLQIYEVFKNSKPKEKKGYRQIAMDLNKNHKQVYRIMNKYGLKARIRKVNPSRVSLKKNKENRYVPNLLNRKFKQKRPYTFASTDITYLKYQNSSVFAFLSVVKDLATGEILSWKLSKDINLKLVLDTIDDLEKYFKINNLDLSKLLLHSDQGFQYTNLAYHSRLKELKIIQSMSRRGNSVDNAPIESFFGHLKDEVDYSKLNFKELKELIEDYMLEYNYKRKQWNKKKMTPVQYREYLFEQNFVV